MEALNIINITVDVDDVFFRIGVKALLINYFNKRKQEVFFVSNGNVELAIKDENKTFNIAGRRELLIRNSSFKKNTKSLQCNCKNIMCKKDSIEIFEYTLTKIMQAETSTKLCISCRKTLTPREREILRGFSQGLNTAEISECSGLHIKSVSQHKRNAMRKLSLKNTKDLVSWLAWEKNHKLYSRP